MATKTLILFDETIRETTDDGRRVA